MSDNGQPTIGHTETRPQCRALECHPKDRRNEGLNLRPLYCSPAPYPLQYSCSKKLNKCFSIATGVRLLCLSIGTPKKNKFSICSKWKIYYILVSQNLGNYSLIYIIMCLNIGTPNNHHFPFGTNGKVVVLGVPILKHFMVIFVKI